MHQSLRQQLLEWNRIIRKVAKHGNHAVDHTGSGDIVWRQYLVRSIEPETRFVEKEKKYWIEHSHFNIQFEQRGQAIDRFTNADGIGIQIG